MPIPQESPLLGLSQWAEWHQWLSIFIGPESDHWLCLSLTHSLTDCRLVNLMATNDTNCLMMSQQLLKAVKNFL